MQNLSKRKPEPIDGWLSDASYQISHSKFLVEFQILKGYFLYHALISETVNSLPNAEPVLIGELFKWRVRFGVRFGFGQNG